MLKALVPSLACLRQRFSVTRSAAEINCVSTGRAEIRSFFRLSGLNMDPNQAMPVGFRTAAISPAFSATLTLTQFVTCQESPQRLTLARWGR